MQRPLSHPTRWWPRSLAGASLTVLYAGCAGAPVRATSVTTSAAVPIESRAPSASPETASSMPPASTEPSGSPEPDSGFAALPGWRDDAIADALPAWRRSCERILRLPDNRPFGPNGMAGTAGDWKPACRALPETDATDAARAYFEQWFVPMAVTSDGNDRGLFTGYYEPELHGSRHRTPRFRVPLYRRPSDLVTDHAQHRTGRRVRGRLRRYWTRAEIVAGAVRRTSRPLLWVDDAIDAFFLEIQGSGRVVLEDGTVVRVNYETSNGHPYVPLGRVLIDRGEMDRDAVSLQSIRAWLLAHPAEAQSVMNHNPSYVFFHESDRGATGAEGVVLTPGRSMAVDTRFVPLGVPLFLDIEPLERIGPIRRLVVAQDTGGAIRGAVRGDLFWGAGADAYDRAGRMRQSGRYWMLVPRTAQYASRLSGSRDP